MTKLEKLKNDVVKLDEKISEFETKKKELKGKIQLEEQEQIQKLLKDKGMDYNDLIQLIKD